jgi:Sulfotransferase family
MTAQQVDGRRLPDFFIVGHSKCGTTALYEMLRRHQQIHMPAKEPRYFSMQNTDLDEGASIQASPGHENGDSGTRPHTLDAYLELFAGALPGQRIGEATPSYLRSNLAAGRIATMQPQAKIIALLREPTSFLRSYHLQSLRTYNETQTSFAKAIELQDSRRQGKNIPRSSGTPEDLQYFNHVRYVEQLQRFRDVFPSEQVLVLIYEDFRRDNEATVRKVLRFLDVDDSLSIETVETKPSREIRFAPLHQLVRLRRQARSRRANAGVLPRAIDSLIPRQLEGRVKATWRRVAYSEPFPPDDAFMRSLRHRFKPEVVALSEYLNRDLVTLWGYDKLA